MDDVLDYIDEENEYKRELSKLTYEALQEKMHNQTFVKTGVEKIELGLRIKFIQKLGLITGKPYNYYTKYTTEELRRKLAKKIVKKYSNECTITALDIYTTNTYYNRLAYMVMAYFSKTKTSKQIPIFCMLDTGNSAHGAIISARFMVDLGIKETELEKSYSRNGIDELMESLKGYCWVSYKNCEPVEISVSFSKNPSDEKDGNLGLEWFIKSNVKLLL